MDLHWLSAPPVPNERNFHYHKYHKSWELKLDFTIWLILIPFAHLDPVNQLRYEETKARDTVSNLHSGFFRELRQWCIQAALEKWICCSRCSPFLTFLKVALWSSSSFFWINTASLKFLHFAKALEPEVIELVHYFKISDRTREDVERAAQVTWTDNEQRLWTIYFLDEAISHLGHLGTTITASTNSLELKFQGPEQGVWPVTAQHLWGDGTTHTKRISHPCTRSWRVPRIQDWNNALIRSQSISAITLLWERRNIQCSKHSVCQMQQMHETQLVGIMSPFIRLIFILRSRYPFTAKMQSWNWLWLGNR